MTPENAGQYLDAGASHVIVTSYVFRNGRLEEDRLNALVGVPKSFNLASRNISRWFSRGKARCRLHAAVVLADLPCILATTNDAATIGATGRPEPLPVHRLCWWRDALWRALMQVRAVGKQRLVLDLSCRKRKDTYYVVSTCHQPFSAQMKAVL